MAVTEQTTIPEPIADRPDIPKSYGTSTDPDGLLSWSWADERLRTAKNYWLITVRPDGRPHAVPVWALWVERHLYFGGAGQKTRNLAANPNVVIHLESGDETVIVEGAATGPLPPPAALVPALAAQSRAKYASWPNGAPEPSYVLTPRKVLAWTNFAKDATRWRFDLPSL